MTDKYKGGLSDLVYNSPHFQDYIKSGHAAGYIGEQTRTKGRDEIVEKALRNQGLNSDGIAFWLTSTSGRHMMDGVTKQTTNEEFEKIVDEYANRAFMQVTVWSHPDHRGSMGDTIRLEGLIKVKSHNRKRIK